MAAISFIVEFARVGRRRQPPYKRQARSDIIAMSEARHNRFDFAGTGIGAGKLHRNFAAERGIGNLTHFRAKALSPKKRSASSATRTNLALWHRLSRA